MSDLDMLRKLSDVVYAVPEVEDNRSIHIYCGRDGFSLDVCGAYTGRKWRRRIFDGDSLRDVLVDALAYVRGEV